MFTFRAHAPDSLRQDMKFPRLPLNSLRLINESLERVKKFALVKMTELKRSLDLDQSTDQTALKRRRKYKNWKFALMFCYYGHGYYGLQRNEPFKTIEGEFLKTLLKLELIDQEKFDKPNMMKFQRAARTDKGVSAIRQVVSCMFPENFADSIENINAELPPEIRLFAARRTTPSFDSRNFVDSRTYSYTFPTFAISPSSTTLTTYYRVDPKLIDRTNELLSLYKGTHNFHNFTSGKAPSDNSSIRYMMEVQCSAPFLYEEMEFAKITIRGQSFMLHQIRKMVGLVIAIMRGHGDASKIEQSFLKPKQDIPNAPGLGLLLENVHYDTYNKKFTGNGIHEPLDWENFNGEIEEFRQKYIFKSVYEQEKRYYSMIKWLETLKLHRNMYLKEANGDEQVDDDSKVEDDKSVSEEQVDDDKVDLKKLDANGDKRIVDEQMNDNKLEDKAINDDQQIDDEGETVDDKAVTSESNEGQQSIRSQSS